MRDSRQLIQSARASKAAGKLNEAIALLQQAIIADPENGVAEHNLAGALADASRWLEAKTHVRRAFAKGVDAAETWLVLARCMVVLNNFDEAERAFTEALRRKPTMHVALRELAQAVWMRSGDASLALDLAEDAIRKAPNDVGLALVKAQILSNTARPREAHAVLRDAQHRWPTDFSVLLMAAQSALAQGDPAASLDLCGRALSFEPNHTLALTTRAEAELSLGRTDSALATLERLRAVSPDNQHAIALQSLAWRLLGDPRYSELCDYGFFVRSTPLDTPPGWTRLSDYVRDLGEDLDALHQAAAHPFNQSIKSGSQVASLLDHDRPTLQALPGALRGPIDRYLDATMARASPLQKRNTGQHRMHGIWSIRMQAGGKHVNHVHPEGWVSSACHIGIPAQTTGREGWLKFGEPDLRTDPPCRAEHFVEPKAGTLVLFPSYMWHGTETFASPGVRLTFAFDLVPA